jgi:hypothetical protein
MEHFGKELGVDMTGASWLAGMGFAEVFADRIIRAYQTSVEPYSHVKPLATLMTAEWEWDYYGRTDADRVFNTTARQALVELLTAKGTHTDFPSLPVHMCVRT